MDLSNQTSNYELRLEELLSLQAVFTEEEFQLESADGLPGDCDVSPEALLAAPVPAQAVTFTCKALVNLDVTATNGIQLLLDVLAPLGRGAAVGTVSSSDGGSRSSGQEGTANSSTTSLPAALAGSMAESGTAPDTESVCGAGRAAGSSSDCSTEAQASTSGRGQTIKDAVHGAHGQQPQTIAHKGRRRGRGRSQAGGNGIGCAAKGAGVERDSHVHATSGLATVTKLPSGIESNDAVGTVSGQVRLSSPTRQPARTLPPLLSRPQQQPAPGIAGQQYSHSSVSVDQHSTKPPDSQPTAPGIAPGSSDGAVQGTAGLTGRATIPTGACAAQHMPFGPLVMHLPPLIATLVLPPDYPSHSPPHITLHADWLQPQDLRKLEAGLAALWEEQGTGVVICYTWLDWLKCCALPELGISSSLLVRGQMAVPNMPPVQQLCQGRTNCTGPSSIASSSACSSHCSPSSSVASSSPSSSLGSSSHKLASQSWLSADQVAVQMLRHAARRDFEVFQQANWRCSICFEDYLGSHCVRLECGDYFCTDCFSQHCRSKLVDGAIDGLRCAQPKCRQPVSPYALQQLFTQEEFARWEALLLQRTLDSMSDVVYCPRVTCQTPCIEDRDHCAQCPQCYYAFCSLCGETWHGSTRCMDPAMELEILQRRQAERGSGKKDAKRELDLLNQMKSLKLMSETSKPCPTCEMGITKIEGCNKMTCSNCNTFFCWRCGIKVAGYDHFGSDSCNLFDLDEINRWNAQFQPDFVAPRRDAVEQAQLMVQIHHQHGGRFCNCPRCGQQNARDGRNNAMRCWACNSQFCALCRKVIDKPGAHFGTGAGRCRQHTN